MSKSKHRLEIEETQTRPGIAPPGYIGFCQQKPYWLSGRLFCTLIVHNTAEH